MTSKKSTTSLAKKSTVSLSKKSTITVPCIGETVNIPAQLPDILKQYAKCAMRTQPPELLRWSGAYFRCLANGETVPAKDKVESPLRENADGLTPGIIRVIDTQFGAKRGRKETVSEIYRRWHAFGLTETALNTVLAKAKMPGGGTSQVDWDNLLAVMASTIGQSVAETMSIICEVLTELPDGSEPLIPFPIWWKLYSYLRGVGGQTPSADVEGYLRPISEGNGGLIGPRDFTSAGCPPLN